jgi:hypothetical protein
MHHCIQDGFFIKNKPFNTTLSYALLPQCAVNISWPLTIWDFAILKYLLSRGKVLFKANMTNSVKSLFTLLTLLCLVLALSGCALMGLAAPAAAVSGGTAGVNYSFTNNVYKTISYPVADVEAALNKALKKMDIKETKRRKEEGNVSISAVTGNLDINIDLEKVTPTVTNIKVNAKKGIFFKDKATATEIIVQTEKNLGAR